MVAIGETTDGAARILLLGDPRLRRVSEPVGDVGDREFRAGSRRLAATLAEFRRSHGFGRAVSAPQIGVARRFLAVDLGDGPRVLADPELAWASERRVTMWDDCMSFPGLLVRLSRHASVTVRFRDERGDAVVWERLDVATSELLQHEIDHLDGVLAVDRALDRDAIVMREAFDEFPARFLDQVDYVIPVPAYRRA
jgi:peptide deformylase